MQIINLILLLIASIFWIVALGLIWTYVETTLIIRIITTGLCTLILMTNEYYFYCFWFIMSIYMY